jgi:hypothetical protein
MKKEAKNTTISYSLEQGSPEEGIVTEWMQMSIASTIYECSNSIMRIPVLYRFHNIYSE